MKMTQVIDSPVGFDETIMDNERGCDSRTIDNTVRPWRVVSKCPRPAEWKYVMKCCGGQALACGPCHDIHLNPAPPTKQRHCIYCERKFNTLADGCTAVYRV